jgi:ABC-type methionine transport system permease subunit
MYFLGGYLLYAIMCMFIGFMFAAIWFLLLIIPDNLCENKTVNDFKDAGWKILLMIPYLILQVIFVFVLTALVSWIEGF